ncbi:hypothetical protein Moror_6124 [Moniliophthora roreri MCA 2997]|uniref:Uncharacterized protein n=1 Tax=Moniliophthora roreri (strain MCA 2997) TaxID=1381753 RepID=V2XYP5_MONRO|nr:hypothetical protein Moror_6124 [Moniliophthora roreri MCA 2997]
MRDVTTANPDFFSLVSHVDLHGHPLGYSDTKNEVQTVRAACRPVNYILSFTSVNIGLWDGPSRYVLRPKEPSTAITYTQKMKGGFRRCFEDRTELRFLNDEFIIRSGSEVIHK